MKNHAEGARESRRHIESLENRELLAADLGVELDPLVASLVSEVVEVAPIDGVGNNADNPDWGAAETPLLRLSTVEYSDGISDPAGADRPSAREVSNAIADQQTTTANDRFLTDFVWLWGQFVDHDIDLSLGADSSEYYGIEVPTGDAEFDPLGYGGVTIDLNRSHYEYDENGVRQQINSITSYIDGSNVYGSDEATAASLREFEGGRMLTSEGDLLPIGEDGFFLAGDIRANENVALTAMHTLWVREHNRLAGEIAGANPDLTDEEIYQQARALVVGEIQAITFNQWLPALLGVDAIDAYQGYDPTVNASIANVFSTAAYRFGHSMLSGQLLRLNPDGTVADEGNLSLSQAFFSPQEVLDNGIDSLLMGAASQVAQEIDSMIVDDVRNFLFGPPGAGGLDLASLNIQRGRDHGLPDYNQLREDYGLERVTSFSQITSDAELASKLEALYGSVDNIDPWVGILAEDHVAGSSLGELGRTILVDQFTRLRDGDRFWYENRFEGVTLRELQSTTLADIVERNTEITSLRENLFLGDSVLYYAAEPGGRLDATLHVQAGELRLIDNATGRMLAVLDADLVSKVVLVGSRGDDRVLLHPSATKLGLEGGIVVDGQGGRRDVVVLKGSPTFNTVAVDGAFADFDGVTVQIDGVEHLTIDAGPGPDRIQLLNRGDYDLVVVKDDADSPVRKRPTRRDATPPPHLAAMMVDPIGQGVQQSMQRVRARRQ